LAALFASSPTEAAKIKLGVKPGLKFDPIAFHVRPGEQVEILFDNNDEMMHNFVLVSPGSRMEVVQAAIALGAEGPAKDYVPESAKVLASSKVVLPGQKTTVTFKAPEQEGEYPYVCTFPGHGFLMHGTFFVARERPKEMDELLALEADRSTKQATSHLDPSSSAMAIVHRTFMPDCSPAAIAVSLPGGHSYCWDAGNCRLRYAWRGGFIKKNGSFGRWRTLPHLEGRVYHRESLFPFSFEGNEGKTMRRKFRGYRLLGGIPEFRYEVGDAEIREFLAKLPGKSGLSRRFFVSNAPSDLLFHLDPDSGTTITCNKGRREAGSIRLSSEEAKDFTITMEEIPKKAPSFYLSMDDLEASYNRKGSLYEGALGQCWQFTGGRRIVPRQLEEKYENNASIAFWLKLTDPMRPIPTIAGWESGEALSYAPNQESFSFGKDTKVKAIPDGGLEAEAAKFEGPTRTNRNGGFMGSGYLDFGETKGQFVEWTVEAKKAGMHRLRFRYASGDKRPLELSVDGEVDLLAPTIAFNGTGSWTTWKYAEVKRHLKMGKHLVRLASVAKRGPNIDRLELKGPESTSKGTPAKKPIVEAANPNIDKEWHLLAVTIDSEKVRVFLDGKLLREKPQATKPLIPRGKVFLGSSSSHPKFYMDEFKVFQRTLKREEILRLLEKRKAPAQ